MALTFQRSRRPGRADNRIQYEGTSLSPSSAFSIILFTNHRPRCLCAKTVMGKLEAQHPSMRHSEHYTPWHGHITVLTIAPAWRRLGHARRLTESLERVSDINDAWFVDLYVRAGNKVAVGMYRGMGYVSLVLLTLIYLYVFTFFFIVFVISCFFKLQANISRF